MDKEIAEKIVFQLLQLARPFNELTVLSGALPSEKEGQEMRRKLGPIALSIDDVLRPIIKEFPDLDPDK